MRHGIRQRAERAGRLACLFAAIWLGTCSRDFEHVEAASAASGAMRQTPADGPAWQLIAAGGVAGSDSPTAGEDAAVAYDAARHRLLLYGGKGDDDVNVNELWCFEIGPAKWARLRSEGPQPPPREDHTLVLDTANDQLVMFGGEDGNTSSATWTFDLRALRWQEITHASAPAIENHAAIYDPKALRMVVFGGMRERDDKQDLCEETWLLDLDKSSPRYGSWSELPATKPCPAPRREHRGVCDPVRHRMLIFGGRQRSSASYLDDVWALDLTSGTWKEVATHGERPNPIRQVALGYDAAADELTVFGGEVLTFMAGRTHEKKEFPVNLIWVLDLGTGLWQDRTPYPRSMYDHAGIFVPEYGATLIYGGSSCRPGKKEHSTWLLRTREGESAPQSPTRR